MSDFHLESVEAYETVEHPKHYTWIPDMECIDVIKHFNFAEGTAIKHIWRAGKKPGMNRLTDLRKAQEYLWQAIWLEEERIIAEKAKQLELKQARARVVAAEASPAPVDKQDLPHAEEARDPRVQKLNISELSVDERMSYALVFQVEGHRPKGWNAGEPTMCQCDTPIHSIADYAAHTWSITNNATG